MTQPMTVEQPIQEQPTKEQATSDFFADINPNDDLNSFVSHMQQDKEEVDAPEIELEDPEEEGGATEEEREMLGQINGATQEHQELAKFILIQTDKIFSFAFSLVSGMEPERYQTKLSRATGNEYEAEILAGLLYKYQLRMSLEYMFLIAILLIYTPVASKAVKDRKEVARAKKMEEEKQRAQIYREIITPPTPGANENATRIK